MEVIGKFNLDNACYLILKDETYKIGKLNNNKIYFDLTEYEQDLALKVIDALNPSDLINIIDTKLSYDYNNKIYCFKDKEYSNYGFNNQELLDFNMKGSKDEKSVYKRVIRINRRIIVVALSGAFLLTSIPSTKEDIIKQFKNVSYKDKLSSKKEKVGSLIEIIDIPTKEEIDIADVTDSENIINNNETLEVIPTEHVEEYQITIDSLIDAVVNNEHLSDEEKEFILENFLVVEDNFKYLDKKFVLNTLNNLNIDYKKNSYNNSDSIKGSYYWPDAKMTFYNVDNFEDINKEIFIHEFYHSLQGRKGYVSSWLVEGINSLITSEYYEEETTYKYAQKMVKILAEVTGVDVLKEAHFTGDENILINALYNIIPDYNMAKKLVASIDVMHKYQIQKIELTQEDLESLENEINELINNYYSQKNNMLLTDDLIMLYYMNDQRFYTYVKNTLNVQIDEEILKRFLQKYQLKHYFNVTEDNSFIFYVYEFLGFDKIPILTLEEAIDEKVISVLEDGTYYVRPFYEIGEDSLIYRLKPNFGKNRIPIVIDENNRYINNELVR